MRTLQIDERKARKLYVTASNEFKATLEDSFGKELFSRKITEKIKTYEDACKELDIPVRENWEGLEKRRDSIH